MYHFSHAQRFWGTATSLFELSRACISSSSTQLSHQHTPCDVLLLSAHISSDARFPCSGNFLEHCDYLGPPFKRRTIENFFRQKIDGNWIPPPDQGLFQDNWAKNTATLLARVKALLK